MLDGKIDYCLLRALHFLFVKMVNVIPLARHAKTYTQRKRSINLMGLLSDHLDAFPLVKSFLPLILL